MLRKQPVLVVLLSLVTAVVYGAVARPVYFDQPAEVVLPIGYDRSISYPVFVVLPPTGWPASRMTFRLGLDPATQRDFILMFPAGRPTRDEYLPDFFTFVSWFEERLLQDLSYVLERFSADPNRIYLGGYSLGGDLSWAISVRNPHVFAGAVIAGTRTSHPVTPLALEMMRERRFRAAFLIGDREDPDRYRGINFARSRFESGGVEHVYREYAGGHIMPPTELMLEMISYVTQVERLPAPAPAGTASHPVAPGILGYVFGHTTRDRFAVRFGFPAQVSGAGVTLPSESAFSLRAEWPWSRTYVRTKVDFAGSTRSTGYRERRISQDLLFGTGDPRGFFGGGIGWDWYRAFAEGDSFKRFDVILMRADRNPWIVPAGEADPDRIDSLVVLRYTIPQRIAAGHMLEQLLNARLEYLLRISDLFVFDAGAGASTVQNRPVESLPDLSQALDQRLEWNVGVGVRVPSPVLWRVSHTGIGERALPDGAFAYRGFWSLSIEYSF